MIAFFCASCSCSRDDSGKQSSKTDSEGNSGNQAIPRAGWVEVALEPEPGQVVLNHDTIGQVDPATGKLLWPALTCTLEDCPGRGPDGGPLLFPASIEGTTVDANHQIVWPKSDGRGEQGVPCPVCGRPDGVRHYEHPQVAERKAELLEELRRSRAAYREARDRGDPLPDDHRPPQEIIEEIDYLPRVFLLDE